MICLRKKWQIWATVTGDTLDKLHKLKVYGDIKIYGDVKKYGDIKIYSHIKKYMVILKNLLKGKIQEKISTPKKLL